MIYICTKCKTRNQIPDSPRTDGNYRCSFCKELIKLRKESHPGNHIKDAMKAVTGFQVRIRAATYALFSSLVVLLFGPWMLSFISTEFSIAVFFGLFLLVYNWKMSQTKKFFETIERIISLIHDNQAPQADKIIRSLTTPLKVLNGTYLRAKAAVDEALEQHRKQ